MKKRHMRKRIGWKRRDEAGARYKVEVSFFAGKLFWERQSARHESREPHIPDTEDWDRVEEEVNARIKRGLMQKEDLREVREIRAHSELPNGKPDA